MPSHEERAREIVQQWLDKKDLYGGVLVTRDELCELLAPALRTVELEAYERAAKVAETEAEFRGEGDGEIWIASKIAQAIRALGKE